MGSSGPGIEPMSSALAGGFLTIEPPGEALNIDFEIFKFTEFDY